MDFPSCRAASWRFALRISVSLLLLIEAPPVRVCRMLRVVTLLRSRKTSNEINEVPFFDVHLPYELALKIFQYLGKAELGKCAQVSRTWKVLAEDEVLWYRLCQQEGYLLDVSISDRPCWKLALKDCRAKERALRTNWKNRSGAVSQLQYELGKILCDVHSCDGVVIAGQVAALEKNGATGL
ncbi:F-box/WD repeat-containing protein 8-like [Meleagris gallopavo]|uniref:F-box/WD repeat-containing protein 8-like n=1 Tax=Meleagris gallopavo TaxID=9103 RepID=UPI000549CF78|nr:F-box/WD repeat-containing protein 8-like [Meleagris gallopavo]